MSYIIAITGKGGVGKTTISALLVKSLIDRNCKPVLAIDADPNTCLDIALGVKSSKSVGSVREEAGNEAKKGLSGGISKQQLLELKIAESLVEADDFDYIAMGRPEGPGCYCYANNVLKSVISEISSNYPFVVLDNEAGLENLSRRIVKTVDLLVIVTDPSKAGLFTVQRLYELALEMKIVFKKLAIIVNRMTGNEIPASAIEMKKKINADMITGFTVDKEIAEYAENGIDLFKLADDNNSLKNMKNFLNEAGIKYKSNEEIFRNEG